MLADSRVRGTGLAVLAAAVLVVAPAVDAAKPKTRALSATGQLVQTAKPGRFQSVQAGTLHGTPFGSGRMTLRSTLKQAIVTSTFTLAVTGGRVSGRARARLTLDGDTANYKGTATISGGTGRFRGVRGTGITFTGVGPVSAKNTRITLRGRVRY